MKKTSKKVTKKVARNNETKECNKSQEQHQDIVPSVALEIVKLLAERNIPIISVDRVFMFVKGYINSLPLGMAMSLLKDESETSRHRILHE